MTLSEVKRSNIIKFRLICQFQRFLYQTLCVKIQNKSGGIFILSHWSCPRVGLWGAGVPSGVNFFFKHGHVAYQIDGDGEQNKPQVTFSS